jgi:hypothetical protein
MLTGPMAARGPAGSLAVVVLLAAVSAVLPPPAAAVSAIPQRHAGQLLAGATISAVVGDVDGDGVRELVRLVPRPDDEVHLAVDVVRMDGDSPEVLHSAELRRSYAVEEVTEGQAVPDRENKVAARVDEPARLVVWRADGRERVLAMAIGRLQSPRPCCLTIWQIGVSEGGETVLSLLADPQRSAEFVRVLDMDADGTDEIVVLEPPLAALGSRLPVYALRWTGERFVEVEGTIGPVGEVISALVPLGDSDGVPGEELGMQVQLSESGSPLVLHRVALVDGGLRVQAARLPFQGRLLALEAAEGGRIVLAAPLLGVTLLDWPADSPQPVAVAESNRQGVPLAVLGSGVDARLILLRQGALDVLDTELNPLQGITVGPAAGRPRGTDQLPYVGMLPGGLRGEAEVLIFGGRVVRPRSPVLGSLRLLRTQPVAAMPGVTPIGSFGAAQQWMALAAGELDARRDGGQVVEPSASPRGVGVSVAPAAQVLQQEAEFGSLEPRVRGATVTGAARRPAIRTRGAFDLLLAGPPGTTIRAFVAGDPYLPEPVIDESGQATLAIAVPDTGAQGNTRFALRVLAVTPSGHGYGGIWPVTVDQRPPPLEMDEPAGRLAFSALLTGRTERGAAVQVDGEPVAIDADGSFSLEVHAGLLPRMVRVQAVDPLGNSAERTVSVVAPLDYRRLPWIPIVGMLTVLAGVLLYVRTPRARAAASRPNRVEEGTLEELE